MDMSEVLIKIAAPLDIIHTVYEVDIKRMYSLITVVCACVESADKHCSFYSSINFSHIFLNYSAHEHQSMSLPNFDPSIYMMVLVLFEEE